jgi:hypothetical protein
MPRFAVSVVFPTPPFPEQIKMMRAAGDVTGVMDMAAD